MKYIKSNHIVLCILFLGLVFCQFSTLSGQVNIEKKRNEKAKDGIEAVLGFSLSLFKGNTDLFKFNTDLRIDFKKGKNSGFLIGNLMYGEKGRESYIDKGMVHLRFIRDITKRVMLEAFAQREFNDFILLEKRELVGAGTRIHLLNSESGSGTFNLYAGIGFLYEIEKFNPSNGTTQKENTSLFKSTNYLSINYKSKRFMLNNVTYLQTNIGDEKSTRIYSDLQFSVELSKVLLYTAGIGYRYDNNPAPTIKNYDLQVKNGLSVIIK